MIKNEDLPVLKEMLTFLKDIKYKYGIQSDLLYVINKDKFPERLKDSRLISIEFERLSDFFIKTELATFENTRFGLTLIPKDIIIKYEIDLIYKLYKKKVGFEKNKNMSELRQHIMNNWKYYIFWIIFFLTLLGAFYKAHEFIKTQSKVENMQKYKSPKNETELE